MTTHRTPVEATTILCSETYQPTPVARGDYSAGVRVEASGNDGDICMTVTAAAGGTVAVWMTAEKWRALTGAAL